MKPSKSLVFVVLLLFATAGISFGQGLLSRNVSLNISRQRLDHVLEIISNKGNFYFSYNSTIIRKDSLVSFNAQGKTVKEILELLFNKTYEFRESGNYIIIRKAPLHVMMVTKKSVAEDKIYIVSGFVFDEMSGAALNEASIYEKRLLASALTNDAGYFKLRLKSSKASVAELTVSKEFYEDATVTITPRLNQEVTITLMPVEKEEETVTVTPADYFVPDSQKHIVPVDTPVVVTAHDTIKVERTGMGRFLLSTKQKVQSLNLNHFFTTRPFQVSVIPWVSTHGKLSAQVVNNFSLNLFGGYTAGTNGLEIGGLFNIEKKDVKYVQVAGLFNAVGGKVKGLQVAGINNTVLDTVKGLQAGGISNFVKGKFSGLQIGGIYNHVSDSVKGMQVGGIGNFARKRLSGVQIAGIANLSNKETIGVQIAGIINYSRKLRGVQVGLINIADTSEGYSIGLINIVLKGYHKLSFSTNEVVQVNAAFKTGNSRLYSILQAGMNTGTVKKIYSFGYGLGSEMPLTKGSRFSVNPEITSQYLYMGSWKYTNILNKLYLNLNVKLNKYISLFAGPSYAVFISDQQTGFAGYKFPALSSAARVHRFDGQVTGWFGWNAGINFF